jgi:hypothetical protein
MRDMDDGQMRSSYPAPFTRQNYDHRRKKQTAGFINDSSYTNASDPNSM